MLTRTKADVLVLVALLLGNILVWTSGSVYGLALITFAFGWFARAHPRWSQP